MVYPSCMNISHAGYADTRWPGEDGGPTRHQRTSGLGSLKLSSGEHYVTTERLAIATTMVVWGSATSLYLLTHGIGGTASSRVERIDPDTLATLDASEELPGGLIWPGGIAAHVNGDLYVVFGNHAHRLRPDCTLVASCTLPRESPYNSFVIVDSGHLVTKDFGGRLPSGASFGDSTQVCVLDPEDCSVVATFDLEEGSIARLSSDGQMVVIVGIDHVVVVDIHPSTGAVSERLRTRYRTVDGQGYGWDPVLEDGTAWFLDNGEGSEAFDGSLLGKGLADAPLHLVGVDLKSGNVTMTEVAGLPRGLIANPPIVDPKRKLVVGYDSANAVLACFSIGADNTLEKRWSRNQAHGSHLLLVEDTGELVTFDFTPGGTDEMVLLDIESGEELGRTGTGSPVQSVLFPAPGRNRDVYYCSLSTVSRIAVAADSIA